jgi:hypothetical protein
MASITALVLVLCKILNHFLKQSPDVQTQLALAELRGLPPAELAFLGKSGDMLHAALVMAVDLTQRAVKSTLGGKGAPPILDYEVKMWEITKDFIKESTEKKVKPYLPSQAKVDPIGYIRTVAPLYRPFLRLIRSFSKQIVQDPRSLRKYFSVAGLARLVADFFSSGYQESIRQELTSHLTEKKLLVEPVRCAKFSNMALALGIVASLACLIAACLLVPAKLGLTVWALALPSAGIIHWTLFLRQLIPIYPDLGQLIDHLHRKDWRISLVRMILYLADFAWWSSIAGVFVIAVAISALLCLLVNPGYQAEYVVLLSVVITITMIACLHCLSNAIALRSQQIPTLLGERELQKARHLVAKESPFAVFLAMLQSPDYDPTFSQLVAIYGLEFLIFLA